MFSCYMATQKRLKAKSTFESKYHSYLKTILKKGLSVLFKNRSKLQTKLSYHLFNNFISFLCICKLKIK